MNKKKLAVVIAALVMIFAIVVGGTLAYFTAEDENTNVFTMGNVDIALDEAKVSKEHEEFVVLDEENRVKENEYENIYPGAVLPKDPTIHNEGSYPAFVRVKIELVGGAVFLPTMEGETYEAQFEAFVNGFGQGWEITDSYFEEDGNYYVTLTYVKEVVAGDDSTPVFEEIIIPTTWEQDDERVLHVMEKGIEMHIKAEAVQSFGFDTPAEAFAATFDAEQA